MFKANEMTFHPTDVKLEKSSQWNFEHRGSKGDRVVIEKKMPLWVIKYLLVLLVLLKTSLVFWNKSAIGRVVDISHILLSLASFKHSPLATACQGFEGTNGPDLPLPGLTHTLYPWDPEPYFSSRIQSWSEPFGRFACTEPSPSLFLNYCVGLS